MTAHRSSGSSRSASSVEPTRSQNSTVSWRRSASTGRIVAAIGSAAAGAVPSSEQSDGVEQLAPMPDRGDAERDQVLGGQPRQHLPTDVIGAERLGVVLQPQVPQPARDVHPSASRLLRDQSHAAGRTSPANAAPVAPRATANHVLGRGDEGPRSRHRPFAEGSRRLIPGAENSDPLRLDCAPGLAAAGAPREGEIFAGPV